MNGKKSRRRILPAAVIAAVAAVTVAGVFGILHILSRQGIILPRWIRWESRIISDSGGHYEITLEDRAVRVNRDGLEIWTSPEGVKVQDVLSGDIDNDGGDELILLCWKRGRYGKYRPIWVEEDEKNWSQHIFVYEYADGEIRPKWMSSYIGQDVAAMSHNGEKAPRCRLLLTEPDGKVNCWIWDSWGFSRLEMEVSFVAFGDNMIHEPIYRYGLNHGGSFAYLYENFKEIIKESDIAVINQETPLVDDPNLYGEYPRFGTPAEVGQAIADAGFTIVTCATNHALDRGSGGVDFTKKFLEARGIKCLGIQTGEEKDYIPYEIIARNGIRFALLNYTFGTNGMPLPEENPHMVHLLEDEDRIRADIEQAREDADFVLVFAHWGTEETSEPDSFQKRWAEVFLDCGTDVVVGTHPHALQPCEILEDEKGHRMLIYYSLGNFISAQSVKECTRGGMASFTVSLTAEGLRVTEYSLQPLTIRWHEDGKFMTEVSDEN